MDAHTLLASSNFSVKLKIKNESEKCAITMCVTLTLSMESADHLKLTKTTYLYGTNMGAFASHVTDIRYLDFLEFIVTSQEHKL